MMVKRFWLLKTRLRLILKDLESGRKNSRSRRRWRVRFN
uniref:Uncharacterized protein n=1 Tax=Cucumis melo TaxID=3656 RepID=A0A9I9EFU5_CUCME